MIPSIVPKPLFILRRGLFPLFPRWSSRFATPKLSLFNRTLDRQHRAGYNSLERIATKYRLKPKQLIHIKPTLQHLLVLLRHSTGRFDDFNFDSSASLPSKPSPENLIEPLLFNITAHLVGLKIPIDIQRAQISTVDDHVTRLKLPQSLLDIDIDTQTFLSTFNSHYDINEVQIDPEFLQDALQSLSKLLPLHSAVDLAHFVLSIVSPSVKTASACLEQRSNIPLCLLMDILQRTPISKQELYLQLEIWRIFHKKLCYSYNSNSKRIVQCFDNLVYYSLKYDPSKLAKLVSYSLICFDQTQQQNSPLLLDSFLNSLMWNIALYNQNPRQKQTQKLYDHVSRAQESIVRHYGAKTPTKEAYGFLLLKGYLAISLAIAPISKEKAEVIFERAASKFLRLLEHEHDDKINPDELLAFHYVYISYSDNPDTLMHRFNDSAQQWSHSGRIWSALIMKLTEFGILSERRSVKILQHMLEQKETLLISKNTIVLLLEGIKSLTGLDAFVGAALACSNHRLENTIKNACFSKYLQLLYRNAFRQKKQIIIKSQPYVNLEIMYPGTETGSQNRWLDLAREQYRNWRHKSPAIVGQYIYGESNFVPEKIYQMYQEQVESVTEASLCGLIGAACSTSKKDECILWGEMYAPQVAIHEVRNHIMRHSDSDRDSDRGNDEYGYHNADKIAPTERFWKQYIEMLVKYEYIGELSDIMPWWEQLEYRPGSEVLLQLLIGLPEGIGERHVMHVEKLQREEVGEKEKVRKDRRGGREQWPWPTVEEVRMGRSWHVNRHR